MASWFDPVVVSALVTGAATVALVVATVILAIFTKRMADATSQAHVIAAIEPSLWAINLTELVVENAGSGPAYQLDIKISPPLADKEGVAISVPFQHLSVVRPGQRFRGYLRNFKIDSTSTYRISLTWKRHPRSKKTEEVSYDFALSTYQGYSRLNGGEPLVQLAEQLKKIREDWASVAKGSQRLRVDSYTSEDRNAEEADLERRFGELIGETPETENPPGKTES
jgi:hypothetical protein